MNHTIQNIKVQPVQYFTHEGLCTATNVTYLLNGKHASARLPWVTNEISARKHFESRLK